MAAEDEDEPLPTATTTTTTTTAERSPPPTVSSAADSALAEASEEALARAVSKRLHDFTDLKTKLRALELAMAVVAEENQALKQKLADKEKECVELQREVGEVQMKMAEIITNITHLNDASNTMERRRRASYKQIKDNSF